MSQKIESKRERAFKLQVASAIPRFPNNKDTLEKLKAMAMPTLLIHYLNWSMRFVPPRPRQVVIEPTATNDARWRTLKSGVDFLLEKVRKGEDLTPHLSLEPHTRGYTPGDPKSDRWEDKDFLLNVMGYHHFHLGTSLEPKGFITRTDEVVFARVTRTTFTVVAILSHEAFEQPGSPAIPMSNDRKRLWQVFESHSSRGVPPGSVYIPAHIAMSGHPLHIVQTAQDYARVIKTIDPKLDDKAYVREMFESSSVALPKSPKLQWKLNYLDLGLLEESSRCLFVFRYGRL